MKLLWFMAVVLFADPVAAGADTLEDKYQGLKDAVTAKDAAQVKKLALELFPLVTQAECESAPEDETERPAWKSRVEHAKGIGVYAEYALYSTAMASPAATLVDLIGALEEANPKSQYLDPAYGPYLVALSQTGAASKVVPIAEKAVAHFPDNEDLLLLLADTAVARKQPERALTYANRLVAVLSKHPRPEGLSPAQWERKRNASLGRGYWIGGVIYGERGQYANADKNLRAALPLIQGNEPMMAAALFHLGMANYQLGKMTLSKERVAEGAKFSEQCAAIPSAYTDQARHNAIVMKTEAGKMR